MRKAFTLIELLVVISIIALLLSIMLPSLQMAKEVAKRTVCATRLKQLGVGIMTYATKNNDMLPLSRYRPDLEQWDNETSTGPSPVAAYSIFELKPSLSDAALSSTPPKQRVEFAWGFGLLYMDDLVETGEVFYCPASNGKSGLKDHFSYDAYSNDGNTFPSRNLNSESPNHIRSSYTYMPQAREKIYITGDAGEGYFPAAAQRVTQLKSNGVLACDILFSLDYLAHKKGVGATGSGVNVLATDGSVFFSNNSDAFSPELWGDSTDQRAIWADEYFFQTVLSLLQ